MKSVIRLLDNVATIDSVLEIALDIATSVVNIVELLYINDNTIIHIHSGGQIVHLSGS